MPRLLVVPSTEGKTDAQSALETDVRTDRRLRFLRAYARGDAPATCGPKFGLAYLATTLVLGSAATMLEPGLIVLAVIPVFAIATRARRRRDLTMVLVLVAVCDVVAVALGRHAARSPAQELVVGLSYAVCLTVGLMTQRLVDGQRLRFNAVSERERMLEQAGAALTALMDSPQPRFDACDAVRAISGAHATLLYEPTGGDGGLRCTAMSDCDGVPPSMSADRRGVRLTVHFDPGSRWW